MFSIQSLPLQRTFFFSLRYDYISIDLGNDRKEKIDSPEAVVIYFASITDHLQKAFPINHSQSQPFCLVTQRKGAVRDTTKKLHGRETSSLRAQSVIVSSRKAPPHIRVKEALRDKTKSCYIVLKRRHNNTKS